MIDTYIREETQSGDVLIRRDSISSIGLIDGIIFDVDGVLIDVGESIQLVHKEAAGRFFGALGWTNCDHLVEPEDVDAFKLAGGFNSDWNLAFAWMLLYLFKSARYGATDGGVLRSREPMIGDFAAGLSKRGGYLESAVGAIREMCLLGEWEAIASKWDRPGLQRMFQEVYSGDLCREVYGFEPEIVTGAGLVRRDRPIFDKRFLPPVKLGIATGRTAGETIVGMRLMGWDDVFPLSVIVSEDDGFLKPDPRILALAVERLGAKMPMYIGDTPDDLLTVRRYNEDYGPMLACMVRTGLRGSNGDGADMIASDVNAALIAVNQCIGGTLCPDEKQR
jgi:phosphoglycolate phosphatase-like HAD superfamily hydrolase